MLVRLEAYGCGINVCITGAAERALASSAARSTVVAPVRTAFCGCTVQRVEHSRDQEYDTNHIVVSLLSCTCSSPRLLAIAKSRARSRGVAHSRWPPRLRAATLEEGTVELLKTIGARVTTVYADVVSHSARGYSFDRRSCLLPHQTSAEVLQRPPAGIVVAFNAIYIS